MGIEHDEVGVTPVIRVIRLGARRRATCLALRRGRKNIKVRAGTRGGIGRLRLFWSKRRKNHCPPNKLAIHVKKVFFEVPIATIFIRQVAERNDKLRQALANRVPKRIANLRLLGTPFSVVA